MSEFSSLIEFLRTVDCRNRDPEVGKRISHALWEVLKLGYSTNYTVLSPEEFTVFRGRTSNDVGSYARLKDIWYPPVESTRLYRANFPGEPVLYAASTLPTTLAELRPCKGQHITVFEATISKPITLKMIVPAKSFQKHLKLSEDQFAFEDFVASAFSRASSSSRDYIISAALASLFFRFGVLEGLMYYSVATGLKGVNLAISASFADRHLVPVQFASYKVTEVRDVFDFDVQCIAHSTSIEDGRIKWEYITDCAGHNIMDLAMGTWKGNKPEVLPARPQEIPFAEKRSLAYLLWCQRGRPSFDDQRDWYEAEAKLRTLQLSKLVGKQKGFEQAR